jgi:phosphatidylglycerol:prolipoprotein diacylglycerol transferase
MRQVLFTILLTDPLTLFKNDPSRDDILGIGLTILLLIIGGMWGLYRTVRGIKTWTADDRQMLSMWGISCGVSLVLPFILPSFAPELKSLPIFGYGMMLLCAFSSGCFLAAKRAKAKGYNENIIWDLGIILLIFGIGGARLFYCLQYPGSVYRDAHNLGQLIFATINLSQGGVVLFGGLIGGLVAFLTFCRMHKMSILVLGDIIIPSVFLGLGFGRLGCFLNGCCYGDACQLPWALSFDMHSIPWNEMVGKGVLTPDALRTPLLHPTQLYSAISGFLLCGLLVWYDRTKPRTGALMALGLLLYPMGRFMIEILRADETGQLGTGLTISQLISVAVFLMSLGFTIYLYSNKFISAPPTANATKL